MHPHHQALIRCGVADGRHAGGVGAGPPPDVVQRARAPQPLSHAQHRRAALAGCVCTGWFEPHGPFDSPLHTRRQADDNVRLERLRQVEAGARARPWCAARQVREAAGGRSGAKAVQLHLPDEFEQGVALRCVRSQSRPRPAGELVLLRLGQSETALAGGPMDGGLGEEYAPAAIQAGQRQNAIVVSEAGQ